jgi:carboxymethylenebutenolidase
MLESPTREMRSRIPLRRGRSGRTALAALALAAALVAPGLAAAQGMVRFTQGKSTVSGYLALPTGQGTHPAMITIHEWWGLNDWMKQQTDSLAAHGYVALAVDLYHGKVAADQELAHQLASGLAEDEALETLRAAADFLRGRDDVRAQAIGVIGWCMGGGYSIRLAASDPGIRACVMYYGAPITDSSAIRGIQAAILGNFGAEDKGPAPEQVRGFEKALRAAGKKVNFKIYAGAGHAFANRNNPWGGYRPAAARDAWRRTLTFLDAELKRASRPSVPIR